MILRCSNNADVTRPYLPICTRHHAPNARTERHQMAVARRAISARTRSCRSTHGPPVLRSVPLPADASFCAALAQARRAPDRAICVRSSEVDDLQQGAVDGAVRHHQDSTSPWIVSSTSRRTLGIVTCLRLTTVTATWSWPGVTRRSSPRDDRGTTGLPLLRSSVSRRSSSTDAKRSRRSTTLGPRRISASSTARTKSSRSPTT